MAKAVQVKSHVRKTKHGLVRVASHSSSRAAKEAKKDASKKGEITWESAAALVDKNVENKAVRERLKQKYKKFPQMLGIMMGGKWRDADIAIEHPKADGSTEKKVEHRKHLVVSEKQWYSILKENEGLVRKIVQKYNRNSDLTEDLRQAARRGVWEAIGNYGDKFNPSNPPDIINVMWEHVSGRVREELGKQVASKIMLPAHKARLFAKYRQLREEHGSDYDKIAGLMTIKKKDVYPNIMKHNPKEGMERLPREGYVSVYKTEKGVVNDKLDKHKEFVDARNEQYDKDVAALELRYHEGLESDDKEAFDRNMEAMDSKIADMKAKVEAWRGEEGKTFEVQKLTHEIVKWTKDKERYRVQMSPLTKEEYDFNMNLLKENRDKDIKRANTLLQKEIGRTTMEGVNVLFKQFDEIIDMKELNTSKDTVFGDGTTLSMEEVVPDASHVPADEQLMMRAVYKQGMDKLLGGIDMLRPQAQKVVKLRLGLDDDNEPYAHGLWGKPMKISEIMRVIPENLYDPAQMRKEEHSFNTEVWFHSKPSEAKHKAAAMNEAEKMKDPKEAKKVADGWKDSYKIALADWKKRRPVLQDHSHEAKVQKWQDAKPKKVERVRRDKATIAKMRSDHEKRTQDALKEIRSTIDSKWSRKKKQAHRAAIYAKHEGGTDYAPKTWVDRKLTDKEYKKRVSEWNAAKPEIMEASDRTVRRQIETDLEYGWLALQRLVPKDDMMNLLDTYRRMRESGIRKGQYKEDLSKSLIFDKFFGIKYKHTDKELSIARKVFNKVKSLLKPNKSK